MSYERPSSTADDFEVGRGSYPLGTWTCTNAASHDMTVGDLRGKPSRACEPWRTRHFKVSFVVLVEFRRPHLDYSMMN